MVKEETIIIILLKKSSSNKATNFKGKKTRIVNPWAYTQIHIPTVVQGKGGGWIGWNPSRVFDMLQYFETILPSVESLCSSLQDEVYFMGGSAAGGL